MSRRSAALLVFRQDAGGLAFLLAHPGGPFWARKDDGAWSIPKGEYPDSESPVVAAYREFGEELGLVPPAGDPIALGEVRQAGGKVVTCFAVEGDLDLSAFVSNTFEVEWPRGSGAMRTFPEVDRASWFPEEPARVKLLPSQLPFLDRLIARLQTTT